MYIHKTIYIYIYICVYIYIYIHTHIHTHTHLPSFAAAFRTRSTTPNFPTNIVDFRGFGSSVIVI